MTASNQKTTLAPYATDWRKTRGREYDEPEAKDRSPFQRDRDRIIHSDAFRRLQYKTQVYFNLSLNDHGRTRLTHSLEVAQITRTICRALNLDEDLGEVIGLSHDLGHPPFGHAGEDALNECMAEFGGFRHNEQTLAILRKIECRYGGFNGLNLTWESLEGIAKHNGPLTGIEAESDVIKDLEPASWCGLEAQVAALADDIAYNHHDLDDGLTIGDFHLEDVRQLTPFNRAYDEVTATFPRADRYRQIKETIRRMIDRQVSDVLANTRIKLDKVKPASIEEVRAHGEALVVMSKNVHADMVEVKKFLMEHMYRHHLKNGMDFRAHKFIKELFKAYFEHNKLLPPHVKALLPEDKTNKKACAIVIANYISMMTDRSAVKDHSRLFGSVVS